MRILRLILILLCALAASAQPDAESISWVNNVGIPGLHGWDVSNLSKKESTEIRNRWDQIGAGLSASSSAFAGTYQLAGDTGYFVRWSPEKGFVYAYYHEYFIVAASYGEVTIKPSGIVHFIVTNENQHPWRGHKIITPTDWIPAMEGRYFFRADELRSFSDFYGGYKEYNAFPRKWDCSCGPLPERVSQETRRVAGFIISTAFRSRLRQPIHGYITQIRPAYIGKHPLPRGPEEQASLTPVSISIGRPNGVKPGLLFLIAPDIDATDQFLIVTRVTCKRSWGVVVRELDEHGNVAHRDWNMDDIVDKPYPELRIGQEIATSFVGKPR